MGVGAPSAAGQDFSKDPVFFIHGHGLGSYDWVNLTNFLVGKGYPGEFLRAIDLVPSSGPNREAAEQQIAPAIEAFLAEVNAFLAAQGYTGPPKRKVDLVAHSMGAVSSRWYAARVAPQRVDTWISLGGANHGTDGLCPFVGYDDGGAAELCPAYSDDPAHTVQFTLNGPPGPDVDETPYGIGVDSPGVAVSPSEAGQRIFYATIRTEPDVWISPIDSAIVDGAGGRSVSLPDGFPAVETSVGNFLMTNGVDHDRLPGDWQVMQLVALLLSAGEPQQPPVAAAGSDQALSAGAACQATVILDGAASTDSDGDTLKYTWTWTLGTASGPTATVTLPAGRHTITLTVDDGQGGRASDIVVVTVQDTMPPVLGELPGPMVVGQTGLDGTPVTVPIPPAADNCGSVAVTSDAPALFPEGTTLVTFTATDAAGNTATAMTTVTVVDSPGWIHGHGQLQVDGELHHFVFHVLARSGGTEGGQLAYRVDDATRFVSTAVTAVVFLDDPAIEQEHPEVTVDTVVFRGIGRWNGAPGYTFEAQAADGGEPGRGADRFAITITGPDGGTVAAAGGSLAGGNIQSRRR